MTTTYFDMIARNPLAMTGFLITLREMPEPWTALFRKRNCGFCKCYSCDWCPNEPEEPDEVGKDKPCSYRENSADIAAWWLQQETEITVQAREKMLELSRAAMKRELRAKDEETTAMLRSAAGTIDSLLRELDELR